MTLNWTFCSSVHLTFYFRELLSKLLSCSQQLFFYRKTVFMMSLNVRISLEFLPAADCVPLTLPLISELWKAARHTVCETHLGLSKAALIICIRTIFNKTRQDFKKGTKHDRFLNPLWIPLLCRKIVLGTTWLELLFWAKKEYSWRAQKSNKLWKS
jgi:hypothetical protein